MPSSRHAGPTSKRCQFLHRPSAPFGHEPLYWKGWTRTRKKVRVRERTRTRDKGKGKQRVREMTSAKGECKGRGKDKERTIRETQGRL